VARNKKTKTTFLISFETVTTNGFANETFEKMLRSFLIAYSEIRPKVKITIAKGVKNEKSE